MDAAFPRAHGLLAPQPHRAGKLGLRAAQVPPQCIDSGRVPRAGRLWLIHCVTVVGAVRRMPVAQLGELPRSNNMAIVLRARRRHAAECPAGAVFAA